MKSAKRTTVITGAASGIGGALARRLAGPDVNLLLTTRSNEGDLRLVAEAAKGLGSRVETVCCDLADPNEVKSVVSRAVDVFGGIDAIVSNAGSADRTPLGELNQSDLHRAFDVMAAAFLHLTQAALPSLRASDIPRVIAVSSFVAHRYRNAANIFPASAAAKAGLEALVKSLAVDLAGDGIPVNCVVPGHIEKDARAHLAGRAERAAQVEGLIPMRRLGQPDDVAAVIEFLLSPGAAYMTGQLVHVDGGLTL